MEFITTDQAPAPAGHYSQATAYHGLIFVSGQLPHPPQGGAKPEGIEAQTRQVLANVQAILEAAGSSMAQVLKSTVYISDISLWGKVNAIYAEVFGDHKPARAVVPVNELHYGYLIEMEVVAVKK